MLKNIASSFLRRTLASQSSSHRFPHRGSTAHWTQNEAAEESNKNACCERVKLFQEHISGRGRGERDNKKTQTIEQQQKEEEEEANKSTTEPGGKHHNGEKRRVKREAKRRLWKREKERTGESQCGPKRGWLVGGG